MATVNYYINPIRPFLTVSIKLCSNLTLSLGIGAGLKFISSPIGYTVVLSRWEGAPSDVFQACLYANHATNIHLEGHGKINGNGANWWYAFTHNRLTHPRPYLVSIENCKNISIRDLTFVNSPSWTLHPMECTSIVIDSVTVINPKESPNTDGLDPESCQNVRITNSLFDVGDDCIAIKAGTEATQDKSASENIIISNCTMQHGHGGIVFGSEMSGNIKNVIISNCIFHHTDRGIRIKTRRGRGGHISDVQISNILITDTICPIAINAFYFWGPFGKNKYVENKLPQPIDSRTPIIERISINNIIAKNVKSTGIFVYGLPETPIKELTISFVSIYLNSDAVPTEPEMLMHAPQLSQAGVYMINTKDTRLTAVHIYNNLKNNIFTVQKANTNLKISSL